MHDRRLARELDRLGERCEGRLAPYALKIDTAGHDDDALLGAQATLRSVAVLHCETSVGPRFEGGCRFGDLAPLSLDRGFDLVDITGSLRGRDGRMHYVDCARVPTETEAQ